MYNNDKVSNDRRALERLVETYGKNDVLKYVRGLYEENKSENPFAVESVPGEAGRLLAKRILTNTLYAITDDDAKRKSCLNHFKKVFLSGERSELQNFMLEIQTRLKAADEAEETGN